MTLPSLTINENKFTFADGEVDRIRDQVSGFPENAGVSASGPMNSYNYDYEAVNKKIVLTGKLFYTAESRVSGYDIKTILQQKQFIESQINGQQLAVYFESNFSSQSLISNADAVAPYLGKFASTQAMIEDFVTEEIVGNPEILPFTLTLKVGKANF